MKIFRATPSAYFVETLSSATPGTFFADQGRLYAKGADGWLELLSLQLEGRKPMEASEFLKGFRADAGPSLFV